MGSSINHVMFFGNFLTFLPPLPGDACGGLKPPSPYLKSHVFFGTEYLRNFQNIIFKYRLYTGPLGICGGERGGKLRVNQKINTSDTSQHLPLPVMFPTPPRPFEPHLINERSLAE
ncbi:hypothetical protein EVAR_78202_1 [Eumeta japonica]|uniref:Uncharacterized protein n=1 Tax=Eumeta variegata TaxID=151549 RepID=A0A4C1ZZC1_EUMVA|nr:hypothetical protein EVAR_78202_1 [Eumeta japonica]